MFSLVVADERGGEGEHGVVDVGAAGVSAGEVAVVVQPGNGALDDPAVASEAGAVLGSATGDHRCDPAGADLGTVGSGVVGTVGVDASGTELAVAADRDDPVEQLDDLRDVGGIGRGQRERQRGTAPIDEQMVL